MRVKSLLRVMMISVVCIGTSSAVGAQQTSTVDFEKPFTLQLKVGEVKELAFEGKKGDYWEMKTPDDAEATVFFELFTPNGEELLEKQSGFASALILPADGRYKIRTFITKDSVSTDKTGPFPIEIRASRKFSLPKGSKRISERKVNGYDIRIYRSDEAYATVLEILKGTERHVYLEGDSTIPFSFADEAVGAEGLAGKREAGLWRTADKTGDGVPDIAIQYFSGGAHCCFEYLFYELGDTAKLRPILSTADSGVAAMRINPSGGLRVRTSDMTFAYWNIHFAGSPAPKVVIDFKNGVWRPNFGAMKKPSPTPAKLRSMAAKARKIMNNKPYTGDEFAGIVDDGYQFEEAFWGVMLDLIYTGNEKQAWKFFEDVWPNTKPDKEIFANDFKLALSKSQFWKMILEDQGIITGSNGK